MENKTKIVIVSCVFPPEPLVSARISEAIAGHLSKSQEVVVLCPKPTRPLGCQWARDDMHCKDYEIVTLDSYTCPESRVFGRLKESYNFGKAVATYISRNYKSIKAIYANTHPTFGQYLLLKATQKYNIPCAIHIQDLYPESLTSKLGLIGKIINPLLVRLDSRYMKTADSLIAISKDMKQSIIESRTIAPDKVEVIYNWQDEGRFMPGFENVGQDKFTFMFLGNINPTANIPTIIHAFGQLNRTDAKLVIAGSGADKEFCKKTALQYPHSEIQFTEVLPDDVPAMQAKASVLILPLLKGISRTAMPSKLPAYMFSAKPVLACVEHNSDVGQTIVNSQCGWVTEPENIGLLSKQMAQCIDTPKDILEQMGRNGKVFGLANFSTKVNLERICNLITKLSDGSRNIKT